MQQHNHQPRELIKTTKIKTWAQSPIKLLIFDFDGVLVDTQTVVNEIQYQYLKNLNYLDFTLEEFVESFAGMKIKTILEILQQDKAINVAQSPQMISEHIDNLVLNHLENQMILPLTGVVDFLNDSFLKRCIGSNCSLNLLKTLLNSSNLAKFFGTYVFSADMVERPKPAPDVYLYAAHYMGINPEECLVIEDSIVGVQAAVAAEMQVVGFLAGNHISPTAENNLLTAGANAVFHDMRHLTIYLNSTEKNNSL